MLWQDRLLCRNKAMNLDGFTARVSGESLVLGFVEGFEWLAARPLPEQQPTFMERAMAQWQKGRQP